MSGLRAELLAGRVLELELQAARRRRCIAGERAFAMFAGVALGSGSDTPNDEGELALAVAAMRAHAVALILHSPWP